MMFQMEKISEPPSNGDCEEGERIFSNHGDNHHDNQLPSWASSHDNKTVTEEMNSPLAECQVRRTILLPFFDNIKTAKMGSKLV